jgi:hypothetical protein
MIKKILLTLVVGIAFLHLSGAVALAEEIVIYGFESGLEDWVIPDWAKTKEDCVAENIAVSEYQADEGKRSMEVISNFPGEKWTGSYVETMIYVQDWSAFSSISVDVYLPETTPKGLGGRIILTVGEEWKWTEMNRTVPLIPGKWTSIKANLKPGSMDWKFFPDDKFRADVRKLGIRIESNKAPVYAGPIYIDNIKLKE